MEVIGEDNYSALLLLLISWSAAHSDECSDAVSAIAAANEKHDQNLSRERARLDSIPCCSAAFFQASCDSSKLFLEDIKRSATLVRARALACDKRDWDTKTRKTHQELEQMAQKQMRSDCAMADDFRKSEAQEKAR